MATIDIHNLSGEKVGTLDLADEIFGAVNEDLLWEAVKHYRASQRAGTHKTKARWEVSGSGKKLWKQKGTGRAVSDWSGPPCGGVAPPCTVRNRARMTTPSRTRN